MHFSFYIGQDNAHEFIEHWSLKYNYSKEYLYDENIGEPLTKKSLEALFEWKNGSKLSMKKQSSVKCNYPIDFSGCIKERYLNANQSGGAIWNIFYLHCLEPESWPIFDQHTYRAMVYLKTGFIKEIPTSDKKKYTIYEQEYVPFIKIFKSTEQRKIDKAIFSLGKFLKAVNKYI